MKAGNVLGKPQGKTRDTAMGNVRKYFGAGTAVTVPALLKARRMYMSEWCLYGDDIREKFERRLEPDSLEGELIRYKEVLGEEFGLKELLTLQNLRVKALIAQAINNVPEFFTGSDWKSQEQL